MTKTKIKKALTQKEIAKGFKKRAMAAHEKLPRGWITAFIAKYPEYADQKVYVTNVARGGSWDELLTEKLESFVKLLQPVK